MNIWIQPQTFKAGSIKYSPQAFNPDGSLFICFPKILRRNAVIQNVNNADINSYVSNHQKFILE